MSRVEQYTIQSLAHTGFAIVDSQWAVTLRPDLWGRNGGMEAAHDFMRAVNFLGGINNVRRFTLRIKGRRDCIVLARGVAHLAQRIEWVTGEAVQELHQEADEGGLIPTQPEPVARASVASGDKWHGIATKEHGRTCSGCSHMTAGHQCSQAAESGIQVPAANVPRRCLAFTPPFEAIDNRTGRQLWPELSDLENNHGN